MKRERSVDENTIKTLQDVKGKMYVLAQYLLSFLRPSPTYPPFLHEQYFLFLLAAIKEDQPFRMDTALSFLESFFKSNIPNQHLLCEHYLHEILCFGDKKFNISPYVGNIQLREFTSFLNNHVRWKVAFETVKKMEQRKNFGLEGNYSLFLK